MPTPQVAVTYDDTHVAGSTITLTCTVNDYVFVGHNVSVNITWSRNNILLGDNNRFMISEQSGSPSEFISNLTLSPLSAEDTNISCSVIVYLAMTNSFIVESPAGTKFVFLSVKGKLKCHTCRNAYYHYCC